MPIAMTLRGLAHADRGSIAIAAAFRGLGAVVAAPGATAVKDGLPGRRLPETHLGAAAWAA